MYLSVDAPKTVQQQSFLSPSAKTALEKLKPLDKSLQTFCGIDGTLTANNNPKSLEERLYDARAHCKIKISEVAMYLSEAWRNGLFWQIDDLLDVENWDEDDVPVTVESFTTLLRMLTFIKPARRPGLGSTSNGHIIAAWTEETARLTIECLPNDRARWVISHIVHGVRESGAGNSELIRLPAVLSPYNPDRWFGNGAKKEYTDTGR